MAAKGQANARHQWLEVAQGIRTVEMTGVILIEMPWHRRIPIHKTKRAPEGALILLMECRLFEVAIA